MFAYVVSDIISNTCMKVNEKKHRYDNVLSCDGAESFPTDHAVFDVLKRFMRSPS